MSVDENFFDRAIVVKANKKNFKFLIRLSCNALILPLYQFIFVLRGTHIS